MGGGSLIDMVYVLCVCLLGRFFANFGIARGVSSEKKEPKFTNWMYFGQIIVKSTHLVKIRCFSSENGILFLSCETEKSKEIVRSLGTC